MSEREFDERAEYEMCEPFDIDHGELEGLRLQDAFVLGVEWQMVHQQLENGREFDRMIHADNIKRIRAMCERRGRDFAIEPTLEEEWGNLKVEAM
jgi:hypothetical protein